MKFDSQSIDTVQRIDKKETMKTRIIFLFCLLGALTLPAQAQTRYETAEEGSWVEVVGDSTLHGWSARSTEPTEGSYLEMDPAWWDAQEPADDPVDLSIAFDLPADSLQSGRRGLDRNMHDALQVNEYPLISYRLSSATVREIKENGDHILTLEGEITCAGVSRSAETEVVVTQDDGGRLTLTGSMEMKMTDFGIDPPTAMFGAIRSADEVEVTFTWTLEPVDADESLRPNR